MNHSASHKFALVFVPEDPGHRLVKGVAINDLFSQLLFGAQQCKSQKVIISSEHLVLLDPEKLPQSLSSEFDIKIVCYV
jgi:hypothetical protein